MKTRHFGLITLLVVFSAASALATTAYQSKYKIPELCTKDINPHGHASSCDCPKDYSYNPKTGLCDYAEKERHPRKGKAVAAGDNKACSSDVNDDGNPSYCECEHGEIYNPKSGQCAPLVEKKPDQSKVSDDDGKQTEPKKINSFYDGEPDAGAGKNAGH